MIDAPIVRLFLIIPIVSLLIVACSGSEERKAAYLEHGRALFAKGNMVKARLELKNALQIDPKIAEAHFILGEIAEQSQSWRDAYQQYKATVDLDPEHELARVKLGRLMLLSGDTDQAMTMAAAVLDKNASSAGALTLKSMVLARQGDKQQAIEVIRPVFDADPSHTESAIVLATLYSQLKMLDEAEQVLQATIDARPDNIQPYVALAQLVFKAHPDRSEALIKQVIALLPDQYIHRVRLSSLYVELGKIDEAEAVLREAQAAKPDDYSRTLVLADFLIKHRGLTEAETLLKAGVDAKPDDTARRFGLAKFYHSVNMVDKAADVYRDILKQVDEGAEWVMANNALAGLLLAKGDLSASEDLAARVLQKNAKDGGALLIRGRIALAKKDLDPAIADFRQVLHDDPDSIDALKLLAEAQMANHQPELASENIDRVIEKNPSDLSARLAKVRLLMATQDHDAALKVADKALSLSPGNPAALDLKIQILVAKKDWAVATRAAQLLVKKMPGNPAGHVHLGRIYALQNKKKPAIREFEKAVKLAPQNPDLWSVLLRSDVALGHTKKAISRMKALIRKDSGHPFAHELLAELYESRKQMTKAESAYRKAMAAKPEWSMPIVKLAALYIRQGQNDKAIAVYKRVLKQYENLPLTIKLAEIYVASQQIDQALALYREVLDSHPESDVIANNLASILIEHYVDQGKRAQDKGLNEALALAKRFAKSDNPFYLDTLAWINYQNGEFDRALALLEKAAAKAKGIPVLQYHLGMVRLKLGQSALARTALQKATVKGAAYPGLDEAKSALASL